MFNNPFANMTLVVKNLLILNGLMFVAQLTIPLVNEYLPLYTFSSPNFRPVQIITHFFMHSTSGIMHILFNMYALVMFGSHLERVWGPSRFLFFYFVTAFGAAVLHGLVIELEVANLVAQLPDDVYATYLEQGQSGSYPNYVHIVQQIYNIHSVPVVGASGAVFGLLAGFAYLFPNTELHLMFPPISLKVKWFVLIYAGIELYLGFANNPNDNVAHFAHLGGALFGFLLVHYWNKTNKNSFY